MASQQMSQPVSVLAPSSRVDINPNLVPIDKTGRWLEMGGHVITWYIILTLFIWVILFSMNPAWVQQANGQPDNGKILFWALIIALIIVAVGWLIRMSVIWASPRR